MDNGFGTNLEGFLIHGNLSLNPGEIPVINGDGSIEASGTFYIDTLREYNNNNGIDIQHVIFNDNYVEIPFNNPSNINSATLILNGGITIQNTTDSISLTSGGTFTSLGGVSIAKTLNVGGLINCHDNKIINVSWPTAPLDAANKAYVDSKTYGSSSLTGNFTSGQIIIGGSNGNVIGYPNFVYNNPTNLTNPTTGSGLIIYDTTDAYNLTTGGVLTAYGGVNIYKTLNVGDIINVNNNKIIDVAFPTNPYDAVNKKYVDDLVASISGGGGSGTSGSNYFNFTSGQILIGGSSSGSYNNYIYGSSTFIFTEDFGIFINNTTDAIGLGTGGALTITGGLSVDKHVYIGGGLDVNMKNITSVATPINGYDAVNKDYLDALIQNLPTDIYVPDQNNYENTFVLENNVTNSLPVPLLNISSDKVLSFITYIYVNVHNVDSSVINCLYTVSSFYNGNEWIYNTKFTGFISDVQFVVVTENNGNNIRNAIVEYTNTNLSGITTIKYYVEEDITVKPNTTQYNYNLIQTSSSTSYIDFLSFLYNDIVSTKIHIYVSNGISAAFFIFDLLFKENKWVMNYERIGEDIGIHFKMNNNSNIGSIQYSNTNSTNVIARVKEYKILQSYKSIQLYNNTTNGTVTDIKISDVNYIQMYIYVEKPTINQYAFYTIEGFIFNGKWYTNSCFIGDYLHVVFGITDNGYLQYTNLDPSNLTFIKVMLVLPNQNIPLPVISGGTGNTYLEPYSVLIGNGYGPIINTTEFIYKDCALQMYCPDAQIIIYNTTDASGVGTGGTLTLHGGASISKTLYVGKDLFIGNQLYVDNIDITPSPGDLNEHVFYANNNQILQALIPSFYFDTYIVKSFIAQITITIVLQSTQMDAMVILKGISTNNGWKLNSEFIGDNTGLQFYCNNTGQVNYTSTNLNNWLYTKIRFRADTTSV